ncbi:hypothetical protein BGZ60DRAFT_406782 [Tricladium varicosporioides]|nr:hypothetical protein BGZ60DRAFT_406782 [Hymenoscyphus varicosporioides]
MFSYLRPHHRRTPSNPTSPAEQTHSFEPPIRPDDHGHGHPNRWQESISPDPTISPPYINQSLTRIASADNDENRIQNDSLRPGNEWGSRTQSWDPKSTFNQRDTFTYTNNPRLPYASMQRPESAGNAGPQNYSSFQPPSRPAPTAPSSAYDSRQKSPEPSKHSFVASPDFQNNSMPTGKRQAGARIPNPPPPPPTNNASTFEPQPKSGRTRLNLLNPMSLLARRRTSHAIPQLAPEALTTSKASSNDPENLDFRIRGTVVHDFSAPRPRRNVSYNDVRSDDVSNNTLKSFQRSPNPQYGDSNTTDEASGSPWSGGEHTPVFTENFEEEQYPAAGPHVRKANDLTDLPLPKPPYAKGAQRPLDLNSSTKSNENVQKQIPPPRQISARKSSPDVGPPVPPKSDARRPPSQGKRISIDPASAPPKTTPSSRKGRSRNVSEVSAKDAAIPKHMKSTSSRFSFDMIGAAEQERLLEDRHRQRALERKNENLDEDGQFDEFDDEFDYDGMDDDDGLEERIPGVNADLDDEEDFEERIPGVNADLEDEEDFEEPVPEVSDDYDELQGPESVPQEEDLSGFTFQQSWLTPLSPSSPGLVSTPRDANGEVIGFAMTKNSPYPDLDRDTTLSPLSPMSPVSPMSPDSAPDNKTVQGLGLQGIDVRSTEGTPEPSFSPQQSTSSFPQPAGIDDDDLYFDDGIIGGPGDEEPTEFDESIFDMVDTDEYGRPLKSLSSIPTLYSPPTITTDPSPALNKSLQSPEAPQQTFDAISSTSQPVTGGLVPMPSVSENRTSQPAIVQPPQTLGLTQDTLAAYQSALSAAAFAAAANGKFRRDSIPLNSTSSEHDDGQPGLVTDSSQTSHYEPFSPNYEVEDDFDYDDALEDDDIIAAANAEALAYDCDGFYGQEFGFYSAPASGETQYANGGYFGPRGVEGMNRTQSGRVVSREPNLTPITERSEYSNRNSFMSPMYPPSAVASPGLAQLAGMMSAPDYEGGDMSLNTLLKLRRGAWGGSQASVKSGAGSPKSAGGPDDGSPVGMTSPWASGGYLGNPTGQGHRRKNSAFSLVSESPDETNDPSENNSPPGSPTLTLSTLAIEPIKKEAEQEKEAKEGEKQLKKHKYSGSAESISYLKEEDPVVGERWILERRRTAESGEIELLGREVVQGGRI